MVEKSTSKQNAEYRHKPINWRESQLAFDSPDLQFDSRTVYESGRKIFGAYDDFLRTYGARVARSQTGPGNPLPFSTASFDYSISYFPMPNGRMIDIGRVYTGDAKDAQKYPPEEIIVKLDDEKQEADIVFVRLEPLAGRMNHFLSLTVADEFMMDLTHTSDSIVLPQKDDEAKNQPRNRKNTPKVNTIFVDGKKLFALRQLFGLTNKDVEDLMKAQGSKISNAFLSLLERGEKDMMDRHLAEQIAEALGGFSIDVFTFASPQSPGKSSTTKSEANQKNEQINGKSNENKLTRLMVLNYETYV